MSFYTTDFFNRMFGNCESGQLEIRHTPDQESWFQRYYNLDDLDAAAADALALSEQSHNVYFGVATRGLVSRGVLLVLDSDVA